MNRLVKPGILVLISILLFCSQNIWASTTVIDLKKEVHLSSLNFNLGDIAVIEGENATIVNLLKRIKLGAVPTYEQGRRNIAVAEIMNKIDTLGFSRNDVKFSGAPMSTIKPKIQSVSADTIVGKVKDYILANMPWGPDEVLIRPVRMPKTTEVLTGSISYEVAPISKNNFIGQVRYSVIVSVNGMVQKSVDVFLKISVFKKVLVALKRINRGEILSPYNVKLVRREIKTSSQDAISDFKSAVGMIARRVIPSQKVIKESYLSLPVLVQARNAVKLIVQSPVLNITGLGIALENGSLGQYIRVQNVDSKKIVFGKVVGFRQVALGSFDN